MVVKQECIESALEIKQKLTELCFQHKFSNYVIDCMRLMADACNDFLDKVDSVKTVEADVLSQLLSFFGIAGWMICIFRTVYEGMSFLQPYLYSEQEYEVRTALILPLNQYLKYKGTYQ